MAGENVKRNRGSENTSNDHKAEHSSTRLDLEIDPRMQVHNVVQRTRCHGSVDIVEFKPSWTLCIPLF
jgi:hypothetical protein